eukprot:Clim_evm47s203 gene=Clim_evmTU47s203
MSSFWNRHRGKFMALGAVVAAGYGVYKYAGYRLNDMAESQKEKRAYERLKKTFVANQETADDIVRSLLPALRECLRKELKIEEYLTQLRGGELKGEAKIKVWNSLKTETFAGLIASCYSVVLLMVLFRIQINIIGRHLYNDYSREPDNAAASLADEPDQKAFLLMARYLLESGVKDIVSQARMSAVWTMNDISLKERMDPDRILAELEGIQNEVFTNSQRTYGGLGYYLLPKSDEQAMGVAMKGMQEEDREAVSAARRRRLLLWILELRAYLATVNFATTVKGCVSSEVCYYHDQICSEMGMYHRAKAGESHIIEVEEMEKPLAKIIPVVRAQLESMIDSSSSASMQGQAVERLLNLKALEEFCALVYSKAADRL